MELLALDIVQREAANLLQAVSAIVAVKDLAEAGREHAEGEAEKCEDCEGTGRVECEECEGKGTVEEDCEACNGEGHLETGTQCAECGGEGSVDENCAECDGEGKVECETCQGSGERWPSTAKKGVR